jgi:hypothetical protein
MAFEYGTEYNHSILESYCHHTSKGHRANIDEKAYLTSKKNI